RSRLVLGAVRRLRRLVRTHARGAKRADRPRGDLRPRLRPPTDLARGARDSRLVTRPLVVLACIGIALAGALTHFSSAAFTNATAVPSNAVAIDKAPEAPAAPPVATQAANGRIDLSWSASSTTTNFAGYNLYRSSGAGYTKLNATPLTATTYADTATVDGTTYTYKVRGVS